VSVPESPTGILTFLIADVRGYTAFTQAHGDEGAARLADKFAEIAREGVESFGGEVTELRGDEALCVFTSPRAALRAAVALQTVFVDETAVDPSLPLTVGMGLDAGEAVPVQGGYRGGALNLAARLCSRAVAGEVLDSQGIAHLARAVEGIELKEHGEAEVKGLTEPVRVFRASVDSLPLEVRPRRRLPVPVALDAAAPLVGRESELRRLRWRWRWARRGGLHVVVVRGPAGIGKTRLAAELAAAVDAGGGSCRYASCAASPYDGAVLTTPVTEPTLVVLDDVDALDAEGLQALERDLAGRSDDAVLVALVLDDDAATQEVLTTARRLAGDDAHVVRPRPLHLDEMLQLAALYVGDAADVVPRDLLADSGGVPRRVHERISEWAHAHASQRLGRLATQAASGRTDLRSVESDLAGTVIDLQQVREQTRLFGLGPGRHAPEPEGPPYRGLTSFEAGDADVFFGRERLVAELVSRLAGASLLGVVGASGSGKSSAVRAGLVPALASGVLPGSDEWSVVVVRPGPHPLRALDRALWSGLPKELVGRLGEDARGLEAVRDVLGPDQRVLLVVDQLEEAFTLCDDPAERAGFLAALSAAADDPRSGVAVVAAIRADYYGRCAADLRLAELLSANHVLVGPMTAEEYRRVIVQPALRYGVSIDTGLVDDLVAQVVGEPGALPLLSTALLELWEARDGRAIHQAAYLETGGVRGAVARLADEVYDGFDEEQQTIARSILLRLAGPGEGDAAVRRRVPLVDLDVDKDPRWREVLDTLAARRLVTVSDGAVEVAHEALLREWPRLLGWLEEDREGRRLRAHLSLAANEWVGRDRDDAELYRGARLSAALDWTTLHTSELNEREREFVTASRTASQHDLEQQRRQNRRLRGLLVGVVGVLVLALVAGALALVQRQSAKDQARAALARELGAKAVSAARIDQAMLLARQGALLDRSPQTEGTLLATLLRSPAVRGTFTLPIQSRPRQIAVSPDGRTLAVADNSDVVRLFDTRTHKEKKALPDHGVLPLLFAGDRLVSLHLLPKGPAVLDVYDTARDAVVRTLPLSEGFVNEPTGFMNPLLASPDGTVVHLLWTLFDPETRTDRDAFVESWDLATGRHRVSPLGSRGINGATVMKDGTIVVATDDAVLAVDPATLRVEHRTVRAVPSGLGALSPDGRTLAVSAVVDGEPTDTFVLVDVASGVQAPAGGSHAAAIENIAFSPDGRSVVTTADDGNVIVWDGRSGARVETLSGHSGRVIGLAFSGDGRTVFTGGLDGAIFGWDLGTSDRFGRPFDAKGRSWARSDLDVPQLAVSSDGSRVALRTGPGEVGVFSLGSLRTEHVLRTGPGTDVAALAWSGERLYVALGGTGVQVWDVRGAPRRLDPLSGLEGTVIAMALSPDGRRLAAVTFVQPPPQDEDAGPGGWYGLWDTGSGELVAKSRLRSDGKSLAFSPDGTRVAAGTGDGHALLLDTSGKVRHDLDLSAISSGSVTAVAFRRDGTLLTGTWSGIVQHWDGSTGRQLGHPVLVEAAPVSSIAMAPGSASFAVSGGSSGGVKVWDDGSLQQFGASFPGGAGQWGHVAYTPDGSRLVVVYSDGTAAVWPATVRAWLDQACAVAGRNFTHEEWDRFVPGQDYRRTCPAYPAG
jgi:WD40 repeat protein/class 3 adenylate cyclase